MNMATNPQAALISPRTAAIRALTQARDAVAEGILGDLLKLANTAPEKLLAGHLPEAAPPWLVIASLESQMPDGSVCWDIARAHLANLTASRLASARINENTAFALAKDHGINLYAFAAECWARVGEAKETT